MKENISESYSLFHHYFCTDMNLNRFTQERGWTSSVTKWKKLVHLIYELDLWMGSNGIEMVQWKKKKEKRWFFKTFLFFWKLYFFEKFWFPKKKSFFIHSFVCSFVSFRNDPRITLWITFVDIYGSLSTDYFPRITFHGSLSTDHFPRITFVDMYGLLSTDHFPRITRMIRKEIEDDEKTFFFFKN